MNIPNLSYRLLPIAAQQYHVNDKSYVKMPNAGNSIFTDNNKNASDVFIQSKEKGHMQSENAQNTSIFSK